MHGVREAFLSNPVSNCHHCPPATKHLSFSFPLRRNKIALDNIRIGKSPSQFSSDNILFSCLLSSCPNAKPRERDTLSPLARAFTVGAVQEVVSINACLLTITRSEKNTRFCQSRAVLFSLCRRHLAFFLVGLCGFYFIARGTFLPEGG